MAHASETTPPLQSGTQPAVIHRARPLWNRAGVASRRKRTDNATGIQYLSVHLSASETDSLPMQLFLVALMLLVSVLASNLISKFIPSVATPLVQIALGIVMALLIPIRGDFQLPASLFMVLFVAPLIYSDSRAIDRVTAWRNRRTILKLAIGLVVATTCLVGLVMGFVVPTISIAAAFVLGAALSPTDPVAVSALAETSAISKRQRAILSTESIVNDATGVVVFNLALAALASGAFDPLQAGASFLWLFFGGIGLGLAAGVAGNVFSSFVRRVGLDDIVFHVLLDLAMPFITFLAGEVAGVSPIMSVMVCALVYKIGTGRASPNESRMNIVSSSVWNVLAFSLNGIIFIMLGYQLEAAIVDIAGSELSGGTVMGAAVLLIALVFGLRFTWIAVMELLTRRRAQRLATRYMRERVPDPARGAVPAIGTAAGESAPDDHDAHRRLAGEDWSTVLHVPTGSLLRNAAVLTFAGGTKGTITLSIALSIPYAVHERSVVIFMVSVLIMVSIVLANVLVPLLAPAPKPTRNRKLEDERRARIDILRGVIERLSRESTEENEMATQLVIADYNQRIATLRSGLPEPETPVSRRAVRAVALRLEAKRCNELMEDGEVSDEDGYRYLNRLGDLMHALDRHSRFHWLLARNLRRARGVIRSAAGLVREQLEELLGLDADETVSMRELQLRCSQYVVETLQNEVQNDRFPVEDVTAVLLDYQRAVERLETSSPSLTVIARRGVQKEAIQLRGVNYELEGIEDALDEGAISRESARKMRDGAYLMRLDLENMV